MLFDEFASHIEEGPLYPCYIICGEDSYWSKKAYKKLVSLVDPIDLTLVSAPQKIDDALLALDTFPMISDYKIVVLEDYSKFNNEDKTKILKYLKNPSINSVLVLYNTDKITGENFKVYNFSHINEASLVPIIINEAEKSGSKITTDAARLLAVYAELDMAIIDMELKKLAGYCGKEKITVDAVIECVTPTITYRVYNFAGAVAAGNYIEAYKILESLTNSTSEYSRFLSNITSYYRMVFYAKISSLNNKELANALSSKEYPVLKARGVSKKYGAKSLFELLKLLYNLEFDFKTGKISIENALNLAIAEAIERRVNE